MLKQVPGSLGCLDVVREAAGGRITSLQATWLIAVTATPLPCPVDLGAAILRPGDQGGAVKDLQVRLGALGYWTGPADGRYGTLTEQAVYALEKASDLPVDGIAGYEPVRHRLGAGGDPGPRPPRVPPTAVEMPPNRPTHVGPPVALV